MKYQTAPLALPNPAPAALLPWVVGGVLLLAAGSAMAAPPVSKGMKKADAIALAQEHVKDPSWMEQSVQVVEGLPVNRPFVEYHAWEAEKQPDGTFLVTARHHVVGPTEFVVTPDGVVEPVHKLMTLGQELQQFLKK
jgi:hypothetical protein